MVASSACPFAELDFVRIAAEVGVECERDEVLVDEFWINLISGEPPGSIRGASPSCSPERTAVGGSEDH
jgi:hypothetical protein